MAELPPDSAPGNSPQRRTYGSWLTTVPHLSPVALRIGLFTEAVHQSSNDTRAHEVLLQGNIRLVAPAEIRGHPEWGMREKQLMRSVSDPVAGITTWRCALLTSSDLASPLGSQKKLQRLNSSSSPYYLLPTTIRATGQSQKWPAMAKRHLQDKAM